jgi:hypothetical protein
VQRLCQLICRQGLFDPSGCLLQLQIKAGKQKIISPPEAIRFGGEIIKLFRLNFVIALTDILKYNDKADEYSPALIWFVTF